jgi:hypothetical protein
LAERAAEGASANQLPLIRALSISNLPFRVGLLPLSCEKNFGARKPHHRDPRRAFAARKIFACRHIDPLMLS